MLLHDGDSFEDETDNCMVAELAGQIVRSI